MVTFTTDGPGNATLHHLLPPAARVAEIQSLVEQGRYFVFRAPGRSGKTTALRSLAANLTADNRFAALCCSSKVAAAAGSDLVLAQNSLISAIRIAAERDLPESFRPPLTAPASDATAIWGFLTAWTNVCPRPLVLFFDDCDSLSQSVLESLFQQLETGFSRRPTHFPWSVGLTMQFDRRITLAASSEESPRFFSTGPFETSWSSRLLPPFTAAEIRALYAQAFDLSPKEATSEAIDYIYAASGGHPYFVQALGREINTLGSSRVLTKENATAAFRSLVSRGESPIDNLAIRLLDSRVRHVIEPLCTGQTALGRVAEDEVQFVRDLGLVTEEDPVRINGTLFRALMPRLLSAPIRRVVSVDPQSCFDGDGRLYVEAFLQAFASFFSANAQELCAATPYSKIASELVFLGFLFHVLEGHGWVDVEFGTTRGFIEITITLPSPHNDAQREVILLATRRKGDAGVKKKVWEELEKAMLRASSDSGSVVLFDKREKRRSRQESKYRETATSQGNQRRFLRI